MKIYLASAWSTQKEIREVRDIIVSLGHEVTSHWIDREYTSPISADIGVVVHTGNTDLQDIEQADTLVCFTETPSTTGGYYHEFGYAMALNKQLFVVGPIRNIFMRQMMVVHLLNKGALYGMLARALFYDEPWRGGGAR